ncbi:MAG: putative endonuclease [Prokaryotic dsDNA virus sp.]|nr:MAG: putative endonuclease [Prokaryotic dsDNA virus sp.]|tara:strand:+ start:36117 stop:36908 length:792 start_codon:yes stop_codon:yes gene_type:complete
MASKKLENPLFYVYKTTNLINGKTYVGAHKQVYFTDTYIGCGIRSQKDAEYKQCRKSYFSKAVVEFGYNNFKKEVLMYFNNMEEAYEYEASIVTEEWAKSDDNYNVSIGGRVSYMSEDGRRRLSERMKIDNPTFKNGVSEKCRKVVSELHKNSFWANDGNKTIKLYEGDEIPEGFSLGMHDGHSCKDREGSKNVNFKGYWKTPLGTFESSRQAAKAHCVSKSTIEDRCKGYRNQYYKGRKYKQIIDEDKRIGYEFIPIEACGS